MSKAILKLFFNGYCLTKADDSPMEILSRFLSVDVNRDGAPFRDWVFSTQDSTSSNATALEKEGKIIRIEDLWGKEDGPYFETTIPEFFEILDNWEEIFKKKYKRIIISKENSKVKIEGEN